MDMSMIPEHYAVNLLSTIIDEIEDELTRVGSLREKVRRSPKPDLNHLVMPERLKCYSDGLKHCHALLRKYKELEKPQNERD